MTRISLVIPAYNEEHYLPALLASVDAARRRYSHGFDAVEVIVADNLSTDATPSIARDAGCTVVSASPRAIAAARNAGARAATSPVVAFIDADSTIAEATFDVVDRTLARGDVIVGVTGVRMSRASAGIAVSTCLVDAVSRVTGVGTGVVFCRRADWQQVGGYDETRLAGEDAAFLFALKRLGRARGQRLARAPAAKATTSARKFDRYGDWHLITNAVRGAAWLVTDRAKLDRFVRRYWYEDR
jgi:glycosyltransferase involved in cell wall biosynthesis